MPFSRISPVSFRRELVADDIDRRREYLVAVGVVVMEMRVDQEADRLVGDGLQLLHHHARRFGRDVRIHNQDVVAIDDDRGVRADVQGSSADRAVDTGHDLLKTVGRLRRSCLRVEDECGESDAGQQQGETDAHHGAQYAPAARRCKGGPRTG
jgi:hypothetical protein